MFSKSVLLGALFTVALVGCSVDDLPATPSAAVMPPPQQAVVTQQQCDAPSTDLMQFQRVDNNCLRSARVLARAATAVPLAASSNIAATVDATALFDWAEATYPALFPSHQHDLTFAPYIYRYYPETDIYVGVANGNVYGLGAFSNRQIAFLGTLASFACSVSPASCALPGAPTNLIATAGNASASLAFTPPSNTGGGTLTGYTATCTAGSQTVTAAATASPVTVTGMTNGTSYSCTIAATSTNGVGASSMAVSVTPVAASGAFTLTSSVGSNGGTLPADYTCDGSGSNPALAWTNPPAGTKEFAVLLTTLPGDGSTKWNWVLVNIPATSNGIAAGNIGVGTAGVGSDGPFLGYQPPCSQGPGAKIYTFTVYALSASPVLPSTASQMTGATVANAIAGITLGSASLNLSYSRTATSSGSSTNCLYVRNSVAVSTTGSASVGCDSSYAYVNSNGLTSHPMMDGITATNLQVPTATNFYGANAWKIPLNPAIASNTTAAVDGPIGVAINGVPIFNPCKQGGCANGDTKVLGELDQCNGHAGRADDYHYHAAPTCLMAGKPSSYWDTHPLGWALDGFAIFGYNNADGTVASRDSVCGGNTSNISNAPAGYSYHVTDASPYVLACFRGTPSPDLANQASKYRPMRQPPVTPFAVSNMTLTTDPADGYSVLQFSSAKTFVTTENGSDSYSNAAGTYKIRYKPVTGTALASLLALAQNSGKTMCWSFQFTSAAGTTTQPTTSYCR